MELACRNHVARWGAGGRKLLDNCEGEKGREAGASAGMKNVGGSTKRLGLPPRQMFMGPPLIL